MYLILYIIFLAFIFSSSREEDSNTNYCIVNINVVDIDMGALGTDALEGDK